MKKLSLIPYIIFYIILILGIIRSILDGYITLGVLGILFATLLSFVLGYELCGSKVKEAMKELDAEN